MPRFSEWARTKESATGDAPPGPLGRVGPAKVGEEAFLVDNSELRSASSGIKYRCSPSLEDKSLKLKPAAFGSIVRGVRHGDDWLRVGKHFLPMRLAGVSVLLPRSWEDTGDTEEPEFAQTLGTLRVPACVQGRAPPDAQERWRSLRGTGVVYEVVAERAVNRAGPSVGAPAQGSLRRGESVELFEWDETRKWRRSVDSKYWPGWMMLDHPEVGPLLRPKGMPFSVRPLEPMCMAALEGNVAELRRFIAEGSDVNVPHVDGRTPLELAASHGHLECCVRLLEASADPAPALRAAANSAEAEAALAAGTLEAGAVEALAEPVGPEAAALIAALTGQDFDARDLEAASERLSPEARDAAETLFDAALASLAARRQQGHTYRVAYPSVWIRRAPSTSAEPLSKRMQGETVRVLELDETRTWGRVQVHIAEGVVSGWMLMVHSELGRLLEPVR